jgi:hypothetical protein
VNVSIRINSPGNNGAVSQRNAAVAIVTAVPLPVVPVAGLPPPAVLQPLLQPLVQPLAQPLADAFAEGLPLFEPAPPAQTRPPAAKPRACCLLPEPPGPGVAAERPVPFGAGGAAAATAVDPFADDPVAAAARLETRVRGAARAAAAVPRPQARPAPPAQRRTDGEEEGPAAAPHDRLGIAPSGGPERTLPFAALVLLAFLFASTHSTLASARSRPTLEAEPDAPPDRPG